MRVIKVVGAPVLLASAVAVGLMSAQARQGGGNAGGGSGGDGGVAGAAAPCPGQPGASVGPDVIVGDLPDVAKWGTVSGITAYSVGTTSCNMGTVPLLWQFLSANHPVIAQNMYRLKDGRFEQIGMSWLKHASSALAENLCCVCQPGGGGLGVGCSDPYGASLNGNQASLGPRSQVDAVTGVFTYPWAGTVPAAAATIGRRLQVRIAEVDPALNPGAIYFSEGHYVTKDDAAAGNGLNNASHRRIVIGAFSFGGWAFSPTGVTQRQRPAIEAWKDIDPAVTLVDINIPSDGRMTLAYKATDLGGGQWHYEYALHNLNSHRSGGSFSIPVPAGVTVSNIGFHDVDYHSGDGFGTSLATPVTFDGADWSASASGGAITWTTTDFATSENANALRWGTLYNFRFDADAPPTSAGAVNATIGLWRPGAPGSINAPAAGPSGPASPADLDRDGDVDGLDLANLLAGWGVCPGRPCPADLDGDGFVGGLDLANLLAAWAP